MFTGLIQTTGTIVSLDRGEAALRVVVSAPSLEGRWELGDSIAVNGVCLTALPLGEQDGVPSSMFAADLGEETLRRTTLAALSPGAVVNLELPTRAGAPLGGHVVQGHVDGTGVLLDLRPIHAGSQDTDWRLAVELPAHLLASVVSQGSITVDGISLTVAAVEGRRIEISVIPHTYGATNLHTLRPGATVNVETDVLAKYVDRRARLGSEAADASLANVWGAASEPDAGRDWLTGEYLQANGY